MSAKNLKHKLDYISSEFLCKSYNSELMMLIQCYDRKFSIDDGKMLDWLSFIIIIQSM